MNGKNSVATRLFDKHFCFESYGVVIRVESDLEDLLADARKTIEKTLVNGFHLVEDVETEHVFGLTRDPDGVYATVENGEFGRHRDSREFFLKYFDGQVRIRIAEFAVDRVFVHAGVVGWKGKAIVFPAESFRGKSTLTAEFVKIGADYYSDDYAVFDSTGFVHPFPRPLSLRSGSRSDPDFRVADVDVETIGGRAGTDPLPVGYVLVTEYKDDGRWEPQYLSQGQGVIEMISHTIPIRYAPEFSLDVLTKVTSGAIITKSFRNDAKDFARKFLEFVDDSN